MGAVLGKKFKVLLIDTDPQGNLTTYFGIDKKSEYKTIYDVFINGNIEDSIIKKAM
ncbi:MAG: chromosome partitioning protein [Candidatus Micrarchaeota archaeon]|nr:MAG: chromosome partitioning protein [Candidatus Micrarchaeota archaeon]